MVACLASGRRWWIIVILPWLHPERILRHRHVVSERAAAGRAAEAQVLQRTIALTGIDDRLEVCRRLMVGTPCTRRGK
jgi:hypothetical protein